jgi:hypothetical protein
MYCMLYVCVHVCMYIRMCVRMHACMPFHVQECHIFQQTCTMRTPIPCCVTRSFDVRYGIDLSTAQHYDMFSSGPRIHVMFGGLGPTLKHGLPHRMRWSLGTVLGHKQHGNLSRVFLIFANVRGKESFLAVLGGTRSAVHLDGERCCWIYFGI